jgi:phage-related tail fiber protein
LPDSSKATTGQYGITKLSSSTSSTSNSLAATASAVKSAYDLANAAIPKPSTAVGGDVLTYDEATSTWVSLAPSGGGEP